MKSKRRYKVTTLVPDRLDEVVVFTQLSPKLKLAKVACDFELHPRQELLGGAARQPSREPIMSRHHASSIAYQCVRLRETAAHFDNLDAIHVRREYSPSTSSFTLRGPTMRHCSKRESKSFSRYYTSFALSPSEPKTPLNAHRTPCLPLSPSLECGAHCCTVEEEGRKSCRATRIN